MSSDPQVLNGGPGSSPKKQGHPPGFLTDFFSFASAYRYVLLYVLGYGLLPVLVELVFPISPPWPDAFAIAAFTCIAIWLVLIFTYVSWTVIAQRDRRVLTRRFVGLAGCGLIAYIIPSALFVHNAPDSRHREAGGYQLRTEIEQLLRDKPVSYDDLLQGFEYQPTRIWTDTSVRVVRLALLISWLAFFALLSFAISVFVLHEQKAFALRNAAGRRNVRKGKANKPSTAK